MASTHRRFTMALRHALLCLAVGRLAVAQSPRASAGTSTMISDAVAAERLLASGSSRPTVAVMQFEVHSSDAELEPLGYGIAELLMDDLARSHALIVVERLRMVDVLGEQTLQRSGAVDVASRSAVGQLLGAQHLVYGAIDVPTRSASATIEESSLKVATSTVEMRRSVTNTLDQIFGAEHALVMAMFEGYGVTLTPDERRSLDERVAPSLRGFLAFSRGVRAEATRRDGDAARFYQEASALDPAFRLARTKLTATRARLSSHGSSGSSRESHDSQKKEGMSPVTSNAEHAVLSPAATHEATKHEPVKVSPKAAPKLPHPVLPRHH